MKINFMKSKKSVKYVKKSFVIIKMEKRNLKYTKKLEIIVIIQENLEEQLSICNLDCKVSKEIPIKIHNGSTYDYHFLIKELTEEFKGQFECLGENTEKYITFSVSIKKEYDNDKTITYKIKFIDSCRYMPSKLSDLVDNLSKINNKDCKACMVRKNIKSECDFIGFQNNRLNYRCKKMQGNIYQLVNGLTGKCPSVYEFCNDDLNKFVLLL